MAVIHIAYTEKINPSGTSPSLTRDQIWKGLQRKIRRAQDFVPVIDSCEVIEEKENQVIREAHFQAFGGNEAKTVREDCRSYYPTKVDFWQPDGALITNTVSEGPSVTEDDLHMTYTFELRYPEVEEGSDEYKKKVAEHKKLAQMAVQKSLDSMRKMATAGELD